MRTSIASLVAAAAVCLIASAAAAQLAVPADGAPRISQQDFKKLLASNDVIVLDTRNADVFRLGHIPGAILLPLEGLQDFPPESASTIAKLKAATKPIVTYCA